MRPLVAALVLATASRAGAQTRLAPNGAWVGGGTPQLAPNGTWVGGRPQSGTRMGLGSAAARSSRPMAAGRVPKRSVPARGAPGGRAAALTAAAEVATGELLLFLDGNCLPKRSDFVVSLVTALRRTGVDVLTLRVRHRA
jgi:hypothetical protein